MSLFVGNSNATETGRVVIVSFEDDVEPQQ
jgi:hypothetical protein